MSAKKASRTSTKNTGFTAEEKAAMKERARELKAAGNREAGLKDLQAKIAEMAPSDRATAKRIHEIVMQAAPELAPRTWYGMPAYAKDDQIVCFFQPGSKFKTRYSTLGFNEAARLDDGNMWASSFAILKLTAAEEAKIAKLIKKAVGV
jgi:uncharacterized protein YdhG (YjbR/CyaY superfamily)